MATTPKKSKGSTPKKVKKEPKKLPIVPELAAEPAGKVPGDLAEPVKVKQDEIKISEVKEGGCARCGARVKVVNGVFYTGVDCSHFPNRKAEHVFPEKTEEQKKQERILNAQQFK